ncbi:MAG TPA: hypothetical protein VK503_01565 [Candidatus Bathyarchaeia archaeon]|nr:hypothetical protein [Candidatus Bathyarchaeia archaeon]
MKFRATPKENNPITKLNDRIGASAYDACTCVVASGEIGREIETARLLLVVDDDVIGSLLVVVVLSLLELVVGSVVVDVDVVLVEVDVWDL